jgi:hypothetical protein
VMSTPARKAHVSSCARLGGALGTSALSLSACCNMDARLRTPEVV